MKSKSKRATATSKIAVPSTKPAEESSDSATAQIHDASTVGSWKAVSLQFLGVWTVLAILHFASLTDPAYWDTILGSFHQAVWLKNNHLDHFELCRTMPSYAMGGPKVYTNSIYPLVQAALMKTCPNVTVVLLINHLVQLFFAAGTVTVLYALLQKRLNRLNGILVVAIWFTFPMFHSMTATINMDLPSGFFSLLALLLYERKYFRSAILALILGVLVKQSVAIAIIAFMFVSVIRISRLADIKLVLLILIPLALSFLSYFFSFIEPKELSVSELKISVGDWLHKPDEILERLKVLVQLVPDQTVLLGLSFLLSILYGAVLLFNLARQCFIAPCKLSKLQSFVIERQVPLLCAAMIFGFTILYYAMNIILPRYLIWVYPFQLILFAVVMRRLPRTLSVFCVLLISINVVNYSGYIYRWINPRPLQGFAMYLERSMEYRDDLICNQKMAEYAQQRLAECDIMTCWPFTHILAEPAFGYIKKPLDIISVNGPGLPALGVPHYSTWVNIPDKKLRPLVFISTTSNFFTPILFDPEKHRLVDEISYRERRIQIFQAK